MTWFTRFTRFGQVHLVFSQENSDSCGIACVRMAVFKVNKTRPSAISLRSEQSIDADYGRVTGIPYDGSTYTYANILCKLLNMFTSDTWKAYDAGVDGVTQKLVDHVGTDGKPVIVLVGWAAGGAHFVVVDAVNVKDDKFYASICDPWDGNVHVTAFTPGQRLNYTGAPVPWSWSVGSSEHDYKKGATSGSSSGWIIHPI